MLRVWQRCYASQWLNTFANNFRQSGWTPSNPDSGCPVFGFVMIESYPNVDLGRLARAMASCRAMGFRCIPGMVWNIGSGEPDPAKKWQRWTDRIEWAKRASVASRMIPLMDQTYRGIYLDLEMYDSVGQEHALWSDYMKCWYAQDAVESLLPVRLIATQYCEAFPENTAFDRRCRDLVWIEEAYWNTPQKEGAALQEDLFQMSRTKTMLWARNRGYWPQTTQDIARGYADTVRGEIMITAGVNDVFAWNDGSAADFSQFGTTAWHERPKEPPAPPDPAAYGQMAFDLDAAALTVGPNTVAPTTHGSVSPTFVASVPALVVQTFEPSGRKYLQFDGTQGQGYRASMGRQLSADYTLFFVGVPPSWRRSNDGTGWMIGPYRFYATQSPSARWQWGGVWIPADEGARHVICCEQVSDGALALLIDGVQVSVAFAGQIPTDGTMAIGNVDSMTGRPVRMELDRLTVYEGVDRLKSVELSRAYCRWYGIEWRGADE